MIKHTVFIIYFLIICSCVLTEAIITLKSKDEYSLQVLITKKLFDLKNEIQKQTLNTLLKEEGYYHALKFEGLILEDLDLSGMYLKGIDFSGSILKNVRFNNADLRETTFDNCTFEKVDFTDAILYYPFEASEEEVCKKGFKVNNWGHYSLIKHYSDLMKGSKFCELDKESEELIKKAECLNKFFPALSLRLITKDLKDFDLRGVNFQNANLEDAQLQGALLAENVIVPNYTSGNQTKLFEGWVDGSLEVQEAYQKLVNAGFDLFTGVPPETLRRGIKLKKTHLQNAYLSHVILRDADLTGANLQNATLYDTKLQGADLRGANLQNAYLTFAQLQGADLRGANLQNAHLYRVNLQGADLRGANLAGVKLLYYYSLPIDLKEEDLPKIYNDCSDDEVKKLLKDILKAKKYPIE